MGNVLPQIRTNRSRVALLIAIILGVLVCGSVRAQSLGEALNAPDLVWSTGGDAPWVVQTNNAHDGPHAVRSGTLSSNQTSWIETTVVGPATVSFWTSKDPSPGSGASIAFTINATGPTIILTFRFSGEWKNQVFDLPGGTNVLRWAVTQYFDSKDYCLMDDFTVGPPRGLAVLYGPTDQTIFSGDCLSMSVSVIGTPPYHYQWLKDGVDIPDATNEVILSQVTTNDTGVYSVIVSNAYDAVVSSNAVLTVLPPAAPGLSWEPESLIAYAGQTVWFHGSVTGSPPFTFIWRKDGMELPTAPEFFSGSSRLVLTNVSSADEGVYTLLVTNAVGSTQSSNAVLTVLPSVPPVFTRHPRSLEVAEGAYTWMSVEATGVPDPCYTWIKHGTPLDPPWMPRPCLSRHRVFSSVSSNDAGLYYAIATNPAGEVNSRMALLTVLGPMNLASSSPYSALDIFVTNQLAFLACDTNGLIILDVSDSAAPQFLGSYDTPDHATAVRVADGMAFVADVNGGLQIISVTDPSNPVLAGSFATSGAAYDLEVRSNLVFIAATQAGLLIVDASDPAAPSLVSAWSTNLSPRHIALEGDNVYLTSLNPVLTPGSNYWVGGVLVVDVSNPAQPVELARVPGGKQSSDGKLELVFVASGAELEIFSVTNPALPVRVGRFSHPTYLVDPIPRLISVRDVRAVNGLAYVVGNSGDEMVLSIVDVSDPGDPIPVGAFVGLGFAETLFVEGNRVYIGGFGAPLRIIETPFYPRPRAAPLLSLSKADGLMLQLQGRRGFHYVVESASELEGCFWQPMQTVMLTGETAEVAVPMEPGARFFRMRQLHESE